MFHAVQSTNCSGDCVLTILLRRTPEFCNSSRFTISKKHLNLSVVLPGSWSVCTNANEIRKTCGALAHICLTVQNYSRQTGSGPWVWRERERGPPASCPGFVYNKKPLFDVVAQPAPKLPLPQDMLWVKCQTEATAGWLRPRHTLSKVLLRPPETSRNI